MERFKRFLFASVFTFVVAAFFSDGALIPSLFIGLLVGLSFLFFGSKSKKTEGMTRSMRYLLVATIVFVGFSILTEGEFKLSLILGLFIGLFSLPFDTKDESREKKEIAEARKREEKAKEEAQKRAEEAKERARKAPGCHSMNNVDILTFSSSNNLFTVGNNVIKMKIRNRNPYDVIVTISFKYSDSSGWDSSTKSYEVGGNKIRTIDTLGDAWSRAKDVSIVDVH